MTSILKLANETHDIKSIMSESSNGLDFHEEFPR